MEGDEQGGFSVFWADDGLDTGPILLQKSVDIDPNETVDSLYNRFLYPEGIKSMVCGFIISKINLKKECLYRSQQNLLCLTWWISLLIFTPMIENFIQIKSLKLLLV